MLLGISSLFFPRILFYGVSGRYSVIEGTVFDLYNARIVGEAGRKQFIIVEDRKDSSQKQYMPDLLLQDFEPAIQLLRKIALRFVYNNIQETAQRIVQAFPTLEFSEDEAKEIIFNFYCRYLMNSIILFLLHPSRVLLICHYWREPFIAGCKRNGIPVIELMHGVITAQHPFYNYPRLYRSYFENGLFPDSLAVYGEYWREVVINGNMFPPESVLISGYYVKIKDLPRFSKRKPRENGQIVILITTQWTLQEQFLNYICFLKSQLDREQWQIVVKPHPAENIEQYVSLGDGNFVIISNKTVYELLEDCDIHISAYSTVLYEAVRYGVCNYILLFEEMLDHSLKVLDSGVGQPLTPNEVPRICDKKTEVDAEFYFAPYRADTLLPGNQHCRAWK